MPTILNQPAFAFEDVTLVPLHSDIESRYDESISTATNLGGLALGLPIISANMDTITEGPMACVMAESGGLGIVHRFMSPKQQISELCAFPAPRIACIGVGLAELDRLKLIMEQIDIDGILVDIAHGHSKQMTQQLYEVDKLFRGKPIIAGNVCTPGGVEYLYNSGATCVKVGVSNGCLCTTRRQTGNGVPQFSAILECAEKKLVPIIADGGVKCAGDIVKALSAGAEAVMIGGLLAGTDETPGEIFREHDGRAYKIYRGLASAEAQLSWRGDIHSVEGESMRVPYKGKVENIIRELRAGLRSGMSYQGAKTLQQLRDNSIFRVQTHAGYIEGLPHGKR